MVTLFAFFGTYEEAAQAVLELVRGGGPLEEINAIAQDYVARDKMDLKSGSANVGVTEIPDGLDKLLGGKRAENLRDGGTVLAGGTLAGELVNLVKSTGRTAGMGGRAPATLEEAFKALGVPADRAAAYVQGIRGGGVLVFVRAADEQASEVSSVLQANKGRDIAAAGRRTASA
jgi:hypothetical protein